MRCDYEIPKRGKRGQFVRLGVTMCPIMLKNLKLLGVNLQASGYKDTDISSLIARACHDLLARYESENRG